MEAHAHVTGCTRKIMVLERTHCKVEGQVPVVTWDGRNYFEKSTHTETSTEACGWADRKEEADGGDGSAMDTCGTGAEPKDGFGEEGSSKISTKTMSHFYFTKQHWSFLLLLLLQT